MALELSGSLSLSGSMTVTTILISNGGGGGIVSSSNQLVELNTATGSIKDEIAGIEAYTSSLKSAVTVSSTNATILGNLTINQNLNVLGSASIQYLTSSQLNIGDNIISVNAANPAIRFGGFSVIDSGSSPATSGSILFDSQNNQWVFLHQTAGTVTSSVLLMGPETYNNLGNETYITQNKLIKSTGIEHLSESNITDNGTDVIVNSNTQVTGSLNVSNGIIGSLIATNGVVSSSVQIQNYNTFARTGSANTFYGSQNLIGDLTQQTSLNSTAQFFLILRKSRGTIDTPLTVNVNDEAGGILFSGYDGTTWRNGAVIRAKIASVSPGSLASDLTFFTGNGSPSAGTTRLTIDSSGNIGAPTGTNIYNASDARLKKNISSISGSLNSVLALNPVKFNWIDNFVPSESGKDMLGFIAQEIQTIVPEAVDSFVSGSIFVGETEIDNPLRVNEKFLIPVLTKAIQEQQAIIDGLIARIEALENN